MARGPDKKAGKTVFPFGWTSKKISAHTQQMIMSGPGKHVWIAVLWKLRTLQDCSMDFRRKYPISHPIKPGDFIMFCFMTCNCPLVWLIFSANLEAWCDGKRGTGWLFHLFKTSRWFQNKSSVLAWLGQDRPGQSGTFVSMSTGGF